MMRERLRDDRGFSLAELAIYTVVVGLLATVMATMIVTLFRSEQTVSQITGTSNSAQIAFRGLTTHIERARQFDTTPHSVTASVAVGETGWQCVRWSIADGALWLETRSDALGSTWSVPERVIEGVGPVAAYPFFSGSGLTAPGTLHYSLTIAEGSAAPVDLTGQISTRSFEPSNCL